MLTQLIYLYIVSVFLTLLAAQLHVYKNSKLSKTFICVIFALPLCVLCLNHFPMHSLAKKLMWLFSLYSLV